MSLQINHAGYDTNFDQSPEYRLIWLIRDLMATEPAIASLSFHMTLESGDIYNFSTQRDTVL